MLANRFRAPQEAKVFIMSGAHARLVSLAAASPAPQVLVDGTLPGRDLIQSFSPRRDRVRSSSSLSLKPPSGACGRQGLEVCRSSKQRQDGARQGGDRSDRYGGREGRHLRTISPERIRAEFAEQITLACPKPGAAGTGATMRDASRDGG